MTKSEQDDSGVTQDLDEALEALGSARKQLGEDESPVGQVAAAQQLTIRALEEINDAE